MDYAKYRKTIGKLLALGESPNQNEARMALLKAQELMARYRISETEARNLRTGSEAVVSVSTGIVFTDRKDRWIEELAEVIAENYLSLPFYTYWTGPGEQTVCFMGLESDAEVCRSAFQYAFEFIGKQKDNNQDEAAKLDPDHKSYARGFIEGMKESYQEQRQQMSFDVILLTPQEVVNEYAAMNSFSSFQDACMEPEQESEAFQQGKKDGRKFAERKKIGR